MAQTPQTPQTPRAPRAPRAPTTNTRMGRDGTLFSRNYVQIQVPTLRFPPDLPDTVSQNVVERLRKVVQKQGIVKALIQLQAAERADTSLLVSNTSCMIEDFTATVAMAPQSVRLARKPNRAHEQHSTRVHKPERHGKRKHCTKSLAECNLRVQELEAEIMAFEQEPEIEEEVEEEVEEDESRIFVVDVDDEVEEEQVAQACVFDVNCEDDVNDTCVGGVCMPKPEDYCILDFDCEGWSLFGNIKCLDNQCSN
ncbi:hypothetical protein OAM67_00825 [bacterium]|nr:hypothetical protein [bacterium]